MEMAGFEFMGRVACQCWVAPSSESMVSVMPVVVHAAGLVISGVHHAWAVTSVAVEARV
jgi:hypothetical protein